MIATHSPAPERAPGGGQLAALTALCLALALMIAGWALADPRLLGGAPVWAKPLKFALSFLALFGTLALLERRLSPQWRDSLLLRVTTAVMGAAMVLEMGYMTVMAASGQASHFNFATPFTRLMYSLMGVGAVSLMIGVAIFGVAALWDRRADLSPTLRLGVGWGFLLSCVLTLVTAGYMSSTATLVGAPPADAATLPLVGWSAAVGDLRPAHFLALHAMQALPLAGWWFDRRGLAARRMGWVALGYVGLIAAAFAQALAGAPLLRL